MSIPKESSSSTTFDQIEKLENTLKKVQVDDVNKTEILKDTQSDTKPKKIMTENEIEEKKKHFLAMVMTMNKNLTKTSVNVDEPGTILLTYKNPDGSYTTNNLDNISKGLNLDTTQLFLPNESLPSSKIISNLYTVHSSRCTICDINSNIFISGVLTLNIIVSNLTDMTSSVVIKKKYYVINTYKNGLSIKLLSNKIIHTEGIMQSVSVGEVISQDKISIYGQGYDNSLLKWAAEIKFMQSNYVIM